MIPKPTPKILLIKSFTLKVRQGVRSWIASKDMAIKMEIIRYFICKAFWFVGLKVDKFPISRDKLLGL